MPKRPCSIAITPDSSTIISADKFGDVYSLPLLPSISPTPTTQTPEPSVEAKPFTPAANELTIHSKRNRKALADQKRQTKTTQSQPKTDFEHKLLLGHVSLLTDLALVALDGRNYIITADRDEHIRVSRGIPQTLVIEGFCLGHTEFITRLCIPTDRPELLISGGGEDELFVWEWHVEKLASKTDLKSHAFDVMQGLGQAEEKESFKITVSGLFYVKDGEQDLLLVSCEGVPALFSFVITPQNTLQHVQTFTLPGNVLSLVTDTHDKVKVLPTRVVISIDTIHKAGSTTERREGTEETFSSLKVLEIYGGGLMENFDLKFDVVHGEVAEARGGNITNLLYNLESLRKREEDAIEDQA